MAIAWLRAFVRDERGMTTVEYAILLAVIVAVAVGAWSLFSTTMGNMVQNGSSEFANAGH